MNSGLAKLRRAVLEAARRDDVATAIEQVYGDLQAEIERRRPVCVASGRCCRFEQYGHRLYVTTMELAVFVRSLPLSRGGEEGEREQGCPFQVGLLCGVHAHRPFGCRIFFCDATATAWQQEQYERFHARIRDLHCRLGVPYHYVEWREALRAMRLRGGAAVSDVTTALTTGDPEW